MKLPLKPEKQFTISSFSEHKVPICLIQRLVRELVASYPNAVVASKGKMFPYKFA